MDSKIDLFQALTAQKSPPHPHSKTDLESKKALCCSVRCHIQIQAKLWCLHYPTKESILEANRRFQLKSSCSRYT